MTKYSIIEIRDEDLLEICKLIYQIDTFIHKTALAVRKFLKKSYHETKNKSIKLYLKHFNETHRHRWRWMAT